MRVFVLHLLDESHAILPGERVEAIAPHDLTGLAIVETWQSPGAEQVLFVNVDPPNPIAWLGGAIQLDLEGGPGPPSREELDGLRELEIGLPSAAQGPVRKRCPECKRIFGHRARCSRR